MRRLGPNRCSTQADGIGAASIPGRSDSGPKNLLLIKAVTDDLGWVHYVRCSTNVGFSYRFTL